MVIEKVHGLRATNISLNDRFAMLAAAAPKIHPAPQKRRLNGPTVGSFLNQNLTFKNRNLIERIARELEQSDWEAKRQALRKRVGGPQTNLRRFGSESSLPGLRRSNSFGNLRQARSIDNRIPWRQSNGNLSQARSVSVGGRSEWGRQWRGFRRRRGGQRALRGSFRAGRQNGVRDGRVLRSSTRSPRGRGRGLSGQVAPQVAQRGATRGRGRGRGRGGILRNQTFKPIPTKEELDAQLDQYMAGTKAALDKELETYMKNAMDFE